MISNGKNQWHYLPLRNFSALKGITSSNNGEIIVFVPLKQKTNLNRIKRYAKNKFLIMLFEDTKILELIQSQKSNK